MERRERDLLHDLGNALHRISGYTEILISHPTYRRDQALDHLGEIYADAREAIVLFRELRQAVDRRR